MKATADLVEASTEYKTATADLIAVHERALETVKETMETRKRLYAEGIVSKAELDAAEAAVTQVEAQIAAAKSDLQSADRAIADARAQQARALNPPKVVAVNALASSIRSVGAGIWSIANVAAVQSFFTGQFGRSLPISAFGQSATHDRMGWDHRNSVDVALHPDSAEGAALIAYLRSQGIPFQAFRSAIPGVATGAHIHIGQPSHRMG